MTKNFCNNCGDECSSLYVINGSECCLDCALHLASAILTKPEMWEALDKIARWHTSEYVLKQLGIVEIKD